MKSIQTIVLIMICASTKAQSIDTVFQEVNCSARGFYQGYQYKKLSEEVNSSIYNQNFAQNVHPFYDTLFTVKDSTHFNGRLITNCEYMGIDSSMHVCKWNYSVRNGLTVQVLGFFDGYMRDSVLVKYNNARIETRYKFDANHQIKSVEMYKNGLINGYQYNRAFDSLYMELLYRNDTLVDILNNNIIYVDDKMKVTSKEIFIKLAGAPYSEFCNWDLDELSFKEMETFPRYRMIMYIREISNEFEPKKKRDRIRILKQLPTTSPKPH